MGDPAGSEPAPSRFRLELAGAESSMFARVTIDVIACSSRETIQSSDTQTPTTRPGD
jgi:hypothetical protein